MSDTDAQQPEEQTEQAPQPHPWESLTAEHFQLLRLAPLPADRMTGLRPLRFVRLGRAERHSDEQSLLRLAVEVPGQRLRREQNLLEVWADHRSREIRFGPDKGLQTEPTNRGLGRFLIAQGIAWSRQRWGSYTVEGGTLAVKDVLSEDARLLRDHVLRIQGFEVVYQDLAQLKASYSASRVSVLNPEWNQEKVQMIDLLDCGAMLQQADQNLHEQQVKIGKLEHRVEMLKREDSGLRFTIACLVALTLFQAGLLIWIATR
ncbi:hypothetical protein [Aquipseudomonas alcaligenes]|uniref:Uncharacterized protein n=1 Tax=Aquipseudomonas alcaligenes TaxID=43263 RepID=A0A1N6WX36_AQUAC|nr:hypothetical protein [Pseudomonas alcaligenes]SIQ94638.1 hypothetical protein SAMN05878282_11121 [Pseudomonas alcaligenes]